MKCAAAFLVRALTLSCNVHAVPLPIMSAGTALVERGRGGRAIAAQPPAVFSIEARGGWTAPAGGLFSIEDYLTRPHATFKVADMESGQDVADRFEETYKLRDKAFSYPEWNSARDYYLQGYLANIATLRDHPRFQEGEQIFEDTPVQRQRRLDDQATRERERADQQARRDREAAREREWEEWIAEQRRRRRNKGFKGALRRIWRRIRGKGRD